MEIFQNLEWLQLPLICAAIVFVVDLIGNAISFENRFVNALVTALLFAVLALVALVVVDAGKQNIDGIVQLLQPVLAGAAVVFVVGLIGNALSFNNRILNALVTAIVFFIVFAPLAYWAKDLVAF